MASLLEGYPFPQDVQTAILDSFSRSLNREAPTYCAQFYETCILVFRSWEALQSLRLGRSDFFIASLRFLAHERTEEELRRLDSRMSQCHCTAGAVSNMVHNIMLDTVTPPSLGTLLGNLGTLLTNCLCDSDSSVGNLIPRPINPNQKRARKAQRDGRRLPWPEKTADIFVYPPEQMLAMLWKLYHVYEADGVLNFLKTIMVVSGSTLTSLLHTIQPSFPLQFIYHFERAVSPSDFQLLRLGSLAGFLDIIFTQAGHHDAAQFALWLPYVREILMLLTQAFAASRHDQSTHDPVEFAQLTASLSYVGADLVCKFRAFVNFDVSQYAPEIQKILADNDRALREGDVVPTLWMNVRDLALADKCYAPGCGETRSKQNRVFATCGGCGIMSYCSKACQVADWKHPEVPHKSLCKPLRVYNQKFGLDWKKTARWDPETIRKRSAEAGVTDEEARALIQIFNDYHWVAHAKRLGIP